MLPKPAMPFWSSNAALTVLVVRRRTASRATCENASESGSTPRRGMTLVAPSASRDPYATRPKRRASSKRSSRPSSSTARMWVCFGTGASASQTSRCPVMPRCTINSSPESRPSSRYFPCRSTFSNRCPVSRAGSVLPSGYRTTSGRSTLTPSIRRPVTASRRSRATVSTSGSSGTSAPRDGRHVPPVVADLDVNLEGYLECLGCAHALAEQREEGIDLFRWRLEEQFVMHLQEHPATQARFAERVVHQDHGLLHDVRRASLDGHVHGHALGGEAELAGGGSDVSDVAAPADEGFDKAVLASVIARLLEVCGHCGEVAKVRVDKRMRLLATHPGIAGKPEIAEPVDHAEVDHLGDPAHVRGDVLGRDRVHLRGGTPVNVFAALECLDELALTADVGEDPQLHLRVVGAHQALSNIGMERTAYPLPP